MILLDTSVLIDALNGARRSAPARVRMDGAKTSRGRNRDRKHHHRVRGACPENHSFAISLELLRWNVVARYPLSVERVVR